tara:strand:+ start:524 stop:799 length:276 start_codon:yes stop_codon:yes gene_type:complete
MTGDCFNASAKYIGNAAAITELEAGTGTDTEKVAKIAGLKVKNQAIIDKMGKVCDENTNDKFKTHRFVGLGMNGALMIASIGLFIYGVRMY